MAGIMVHEFTHISFGSVDDAYNCSLGFGENGSFTPGVLLLKRTPGASLRNADSYSCWVEDSTVNGIGPASSPKLW